MAKVNTEISFTDNVSLGLRKVQAEVGNVSKGFGDMALKLMGVNSAMQIVSMAKSKFMQLGGEITQCTAAYQYQSEQELKLETIMKKRMNATQGDIQAIKDLAAAQQQVGIYGDEMILQGAQELASFTSNRKAIETLVPAMNNLIAQQYGYNATGMDFQHTADMMGKVLSGQVGALSRLGYIFTEDEKKMLKTGNEMERAATLAKIITDNVGEMNQALAGTDVGKIQNVNKTIGDLKEQIGGLIMPFMSFYKQMTGQWNIKFHKNIISAINFIRDNIDNLVIVIGVLGASILFAGVCFTVLKYKAIASAVASAVAWIAAHGVLILIILAITAVIAAISALLIYSEKTFPFIGGLIEGVARVFEELGYQIEYYIGKGLESTYDYFLKFCDLIWAGLEKVGELSDKIFGTSFAKNISNMRSWVQANAKLNLGWEDKRQGFGNAFDSGVASGLAAGKDLSNKFQAQIGKLTSAFKGSKDNISKGIKDALKTDGGTLSVADKNLVNIADDYHELLSARAAERFNLQYSTMTPELNISNINVNNETDEENLISRLVSMLDEAARADLRRG